MKLRIRLFASLRERAGADELAEDALPDELDVAGLKRELERRHPELGPLDHVRGVVGTRYVPDDTPLAAGDEVALLPPVSGGSGASEGAARAAADPLEAGVFELCPEPLDPARCQARVEHPSCGAAVVFTGTTRDTNRGRSVVRLAYEAFDAMTGPEMARIFAECRALHGAPPDGSAPDRALRMLCQHRTGTVGVGEPSVVIAVASPHRDGAFRACRFLIDALKQRMPIWKKELYVDGEHWIGERS